MYRNILKRKTINVLRRKKNFFNDQSTKSVPYGPIHNIWAIESVPLPLPSASPSLPLPFCFSHSASPLCLSHSASPCLPLSLFLILLLSFSLSILLLLSFLSFFSPVLFSYSFSLFPSPFSLFLYLSVSPYLSPPRLFPSLPFSPPFSLPFWGWSCENVTSQDSAPPPVWRTVSSLPTGYTCTALYNIKLTSAVARLIILQLAIIDGF